MIIKEISTKRFAGIHSKTGNDSIKLTSGINVIYGRNEAGKSTLVNLISSTLFQEKRTPVFEGNFFPADGRSDTVNGNLEIENNGELYFIERTWQKGSTSSNPKLTAKASGEVNTTDDSVREKLGKILGHGKGIYTELLLSPQKDSADNLKYLLEDKDKTRTSRQELAAVVTQALGETGGYKISEFEKAVEDKINQLAGNYWDIDNDRPKEKSGGGRYVFAKTNPNSELLRRAYYALEDAKAAKEAQNRLYEKNKEKTDAENIYNNFLRYKGQIEALKINREMAERLEIGIDRMREVQRAWPEVKTNLEKAEILKDEYNKRALLDKFNSAKEVHFVLTDINDKLNNNSYPTREETETAELSENKIKDNSRRLGMELSAKIKMLSGHSVIIKSVRTGETLDINALITEAVSVEIPGVMEMTLAPADVNADEIMAEITKYEAIGNGIFEKYTVTSVSELKALAEQKITLGREKDKQETRLENILNGKEFSELENEAALLGNNENIGNIREMPAIEADIAALCGNKQLRDFVVEKGTQLKNYEADYISTDALSAKLSADTEELKKAREAVGSVGNIPREYLANNAETELEKKLNSAKEAEEKAAEVYRKALVQLSGLYSDFKDDLCEAEKDCERILNERKNELGNWLHIRKAYEEIKDSEPYKDLAEKFADYLGIISGNKDKSDCGGKTLDLKINDSIDYGLLSEGTKETVYLAFRLAVLEHLFPDGGGVIVLDDPLNDMDPDRVKKSCELIKKSADRHQIILLTCREEYSELLGVKGKEIMI